MKKEMNIEKGRPLPPGAGSKGRMRWPLFEMKVGDSFYTENASGSTLTSCAKRQGVRICTRTEGKGLRCWRIA
jgi:hypothetical protein